MNHQKEFIHLSNIRYEDIPYSNESEAERNLGHKNKWLRLGVSSLKDLAKELRLKVEVSKNPSGSIDRGYVTAFFSSQDSVESKYVYVSIADGTNSILYRTAKNNKDFSGGSNNNTGIREDGFKKLKDFLINNLK